MRVTPLRWQTLAPILIASLLAAGTLACAVDMDEIGDVDGNGVVDALDVRLAMQHAEGLITLTAVEQERADFDGDGQVTEEDSRMIGQMILGLAFPAVIAPNTQIADEETRDALSSYDPSSGELVFDSWTDLLLELEDGDFFVSEESEEAPDGFLRVVEGIHASGGQVVVETRQANLSDIVKEGEAELANEVMTLTEDDFDDAYPIADDWPVVVVGQTLGEHDTETVDPSQWDQSLVSGESDWTPPGDAAPKPQALIEFNKEVGKSYTLVGRETAEGSTVGAGATVTINAHFDLTIALDVGMRFSILNPDHFHIYARFTESSSLTIKAEASVGFEWEKVLFRKAFRTIKFFIGPVPVIIRPVLVVSIKADGSIFCSMEGGITQGLDLVGGVKYNQATTSGEWEVLQPIGDYTIEGGDLGESDGWDVVKAAWIGIETFPDPFDDDFDFCDFINDTVSAGFNTSLAIGPQLDFLFYGVGGPYIGMELFGELDGNFMASDEPWITLAAGVTAEAGITLDILWGLITISKGWTLFEMRLDTEDTDDDGVLIEFYSDAADALAWQGGPLGPVFAAEDVAIAHSSTQAGLVTFTFPSDIDDWTGSSPALEYFVDFGDGQGSGWASSLTLSHQYAAAPASLVRKEVTFKVRNATCHTVERAGEVFPKDEAPVVDFDWLEDAELVVSFVGSATDDDSEVDWSTAVWSFGDGTTATGVRNCTHTFPDDSDHNVMLTLTDDFGRSGSETKIVTPVNDIPYGTIKFYQGRPEVDQTNPNYQDLMLTAEDKQSPCEVRIDASVIDDDVPNDPGLVKRACWIIENDGSSGVTRKMIGDGVGSFDDVAFETTLLEGTYTISLWLIDDVGDKQCGTWTGNVPDGQDVGVDSSNPCCAEGVCSKSLEVGPPPLGSIKVTVTDAVTGGPIEGADVFVHLYAQANATTNEFGEALLDGDHLPIDAHMIAVGKAGYIVSEATVSNSEEETVEVPVSLTLDADQMTVLNGVVDTGLEGIGVSVTPLAGQGLSPVSTTTGLNGQFSVGLASGYYEVEASGSFYTKEQCEVLSIGGSAYRGVEVDGTTVYDVPLSDEPLVFSPTLNDLGDSAGSLHPDIVNYEHVWGNGQPALYLAGHNDSDDEYVFGVLHRWKTEPDFDWIGLPAGVEIPRDLWGCRTESTPILLGSDGEGGASEAHSVHEYGYWGWQTLDDGIDESAVTYDLWMSENGSHLFISGIVGRDTSNPGYVRVVEETKPGTIKGEDFVLDDPGVGPEMESIWLRGIHGSSASNVIAVGDGSGRAGGPDSVAFFHFNGSAWTEEVYPVPFYAALFDVWVGVGVAYAVGSNGTILCRDENGWWPMSSGTSEHLYAVWGNAPDDVYAVGSNGTVLHYDGRGYWLPWLVGVEENLWDVWGDGTGHVIVVGDDHRILEQLP